jgi:hypothetical protein
MEQNIKNGKQEEPSAVNAMKTLTKVPSKSQWTGKTS